MNKKNIVIVNFWGLGDLIASLSFIKKNENHIYYIITPQNKKKVEQLVKILDVKTIVNVSRFEKRIFLVIDILIKILQNRLIIFTAPLAGKSRKFAKFLSFFYKNSILAEEKGNIYFLNEKIKINY